VRIGSGFDVHKLVEDRPLIIGGVNIPYHMGLLGHSDADVLMHAVTDAILGALSLGDIGSWFPDTDNEYKDIDSGVLLKKVWDGILMNGWKLVNLDSTVLAQSPKLRPYVDQMRLNIANILEVEIDLISVKATTTEKLGFVGRQEGIAAEATVLLQKQ